MWCVNLKLRTSGHTANTTPKRSACRDRNLSNLGFKFGELATKLGSGTETRKLSAREDQCPHHPYHTVLAAGFPSKTWTRFGMIWGYIATWIQYVQKCPKIPSFRLCPRPIGRGATTCRSRGRTGKVSKNGWYPVIPYPNQWVCDGFVSVSIPISLIMFD